MKKSLIGITLAAALSGGALLAQDLTGTWQGTLQAGRELRIVIKISRTDAGVLQGVMYSIDQGAQGLPAGTVTLQGAAVRITIPGIGGTYDGKLNSDETSIAGTWTQGPAPAPPNLKISVRRPWRQSPGSGGK